MDQVIDSVARNPNNPRFPVLSAQPSSKDVRQNFNISDVMQWGALTAVSFPVGYISGKRVDRYLARPSMWVTGLLGSIGGYLLAYQNSCFRLQGYKDNRGDIRRFQSQDKERGR
uniref:Uncharacterized protein AlNc14C277G10064 n=1 Tax=Albugo laibachii Nc14 TaxID=890382 RepID=F0WUQ7_9STRA|nr:conserved hypothetical protein [Albugo laibachii Nc14]|eukprot:CCA25139.1 conserved hypothetical protein [Albugo laibachii Nc14]